MMLWKIHALILRNFPIPLIPYHKEESFQGKGCFSGVYTLQQTSQNIPPNGFGRKIIDSNINMLAGGGYRDRSPEGSCFHSPSNYIDYNLVNSPTPATKDPAFTSQLTS